MNGPSISFGGFLKTTTYRPNEGLNFMTSFLKLSKCYKELGLNGYLVYLNGKLLLLCDNHVQCIRNN